MHPESGDETGPAKPGNMNTNAHEQGDGQMKTKIRKLKLIQTWNNGYGIHRNNR